MSDETKKDEQDEVEAHHFAKSVNDESQDEAEGEGDFEAHRFAKGSPSKNRMSKD